MHIALEESAERKIHLRLLSSQRLYIRRTIMQSCHSQLRQLLAIIALTQCSTTNHAS